MAQREGQLCEGTTVLAVVGKKKEYHKKLTHARNAGMGYENPRTGFTSINGKSWIIDGM
jgi:hypothetical protein